MTRRYYSSTAQRTTLANPLSNSATTMIVASVAGHPGTRPYTLILDIDTINEEIVTVTAASGTTLTVLRGEDGTTAVAHDLGSSVVHGFTGRDLGEPQAHMDTTDGVHGVTGDVVGTGGAQTLIDKSMDGLENTFTNLPQSAVTGLVSDLASKAPINSPTFTGNPVLPGTTVIGDVDAAELQRVNGVTSNIQTQLDSKAPINSPTFTGTVSLPTDTSIGSVTADEIANLAGTTSNLQSQITAITGGGVAVPPGGATDEILVKLSGADYDMAWKPLSYLAYIPGTGGDYVVTDGAITGGDSTGTYTSGTYTYRWHKFTTTGATLQLSVSEAVIGDILIVGGGGAGGSGFSFDGGSGGAGAYYEAPYAFGLGLHNCTIGLGGTLDGADGEDTRFDDVIAYGGGGGCPHYSAAPAGSGGSGGGGSAGYGTAGGTALGGSLDGGTTSTTASFRCSNGSGGGYHLGGGSGGGAGGVGTGWASTITGSSVTYAAVGSSAANTGNGGSTGFNTFGAGGTGIVICRYRIA